MSGPVDRMTTHGFSGYNDESDDIHELKQAVLAIRARQKAANIHDPGCRSGGYTDPYAPTMCDCWLTTEWDTA